MDDIVKKALAKWPNVPHCYGWLALDARGNWRMRDERAQKLGLPGERIANAALIGFINRNYTHDEAGRWYFQNGPQRVYINLELTPYIARTEPQSGFELHTGARLASIDEAWVLDSGTLVMRSGEILAAVDDRDMARCLPMLYMDDLPAGDEQLLAWLERRETAGDLLLRCDAEARAVRVRRITRGELAMHFGFSPDPQANPTI